MATVAPSDRTFHATDVEGTQALSDRQIYRETVTAVADRAKAVMDAGLHGRIDKAVALVLAGDVELLPTGKAQVASQSHGQTTYFVVNGECTCKDFPKARDGWCKHRLASAIAKRTAQALALADARLASQPEWSPEVPDNGCNVVLDADGVPCHAVQAPCPGHGVPAQVPPLPEAPASVNVRFLVQGREVQLTLRDTDEHRLLERLAQVLTAYPVPDAPQTPASQGTASQGQDWCSKHGAQMKLNVNTKGTWYSHQSPDGDWCKGR